MVNQAFSVQQVLHGAVVKLEPHSCVLASVPQVLSHARWRRVMARASGWPTRILGKCLGVALGVLAGSLPVEAQSTGAIAGTVRDATGGVLPGVTVEASSPTLIEKVRTVVTDEQGQFRI